MLGNVTYGVVIPCLNEAMTIAPLVRRVREYIPRVMVIDDGSTDGTASLAAQAGASTISLAQSLGKGAALASGLRWAEGQNLSWVLLMDGDGQHSPEDIPRFLERQTNTAAAMVIGNRMTEASRMPRLRWIANLWMSRSISFLAGCVLPDTQCGFRLLHVPSWSALQLRTSHFEFESEVLLAFIQAGHHVEFVPIHVIYGHERSKIRLLRDTWRWLAWVISIKRHWPSGGIMTESGSHSRTLFTSSPGGS